MSGDMRAAINSTAEHAAGASGAPLVGEYLAANRVLMNLEVASRKRLFECLAALAASAQAGLDADAVCAALTRREKLGSTDLGGGVVLPHARCGGFAAPVIAIARLATPLKYEAADSRPVWLAVCVLAPDEDNATHLQLLAALAACFNHPSFLADIKKSRNAAELIAHFARRQ